MCKHIFYVLRLFAKFVRTPFVWCLKRISKRTKTIRLCYYTHTLVCVIRFLLWTVIYSSWPTRERPVNRSNGVSRLCTLRCVFRRYVWGNNILKKKKRFTCRTSAPSTDNSSSMVDKRTNMCIENVTITRHSKLLFRLFFIGEIFPYGKIRPKLAIAYNKRTLWSFVIF